MSEKSIGDIIKDLTGGGSKSSSNDYPKLKTKSVNENQEFPELRSKLEHSERYIPKKEDEWLFSIFFWSKW